MLFIIALAACGATLIGGLFALYLKDRLHLVLGFSAGAIIGIALFDLLPESLMLSGSAFRVSTITAFVALGFFTYMILDRFILFHSHTEDGNGHACERADSGMLGAGSLAFHSFLDGMAIGLAFQVSSAVGVVVTTAVLVHDFSDGINTVNLILRGAGKRTLALLWLVVDALAPVLGIVATNFFTLSVSVLGIVLALFSGFFLYIGATDLLPESHHNHPRALTTVMTLLGVLVMFGAIRLAEL